MGFGAGFAQAFGQGLQGISSNLNQIGRDKRQQKNALTLLAARNQAELEQKQRERDQAKQDAISALSGVQLQKGVKRELNPNFDPNATFEFNPANAGDDPAQAAAIFGQGTQVPQAQKLNREQAAQKLQSLLSGNVPLDERTSKMLEGLKGFVNGVPQYIETPEYYSNDEKYGMKTAGIFDEAYKAQNTKQEEAVRLKEIESSDLPAPMKQALKASVLAGKGGAGLGREFYINPYEASRIDYTKARTQDIGTDNERADKGLSLKEAYQNRMLELKAQGLTQTQAHQKIMEEQGFARISNSQQPTISVSTVNDKGETVTVRQKGTTLNKQKPAINFNYSPVLKRGG